MNAPNTTQKKFNTDFFALDVKDGLGRQCTQSKQNFYAMQSFATYRLPRALASNIQDPFFKAH